MMVTKSGMSHHQRVASQSLTLDTSCVPFPDLEAASPFDTSSPPISPPSSANSPVTPRKKRRDTIGRRLKIRSGINLRVSDYKLRQYTDYDTRGVPLRSPYCSPPIWTGNTFGEPDIQSSLDEYEDAICPTLPILDVFSVKTVNAALADPGAAARMRQFGESRGRTKDIDFLLKVEEYNQALKAVESFITDASHKFAGMAKSAPVRVPLKMAKSLNSDIRDASSTLLPRLDGLFSDAKVLVEQILAQDIYPDFIKNQLSLSLQTIGPGYSPNQVCPGFGEAFCITDPRANDNPVVYASDGLACLSGYPLHEIFTKNCRFMQGPGTRASGIDRMRDSMAKNKEFSELVLNYKKDGRPYWNLMFVAPLAGVDGTVRYQLGGQIDVSEMLETQGDITSVLSYTPPLAENISPFDDYQDHNNKDYLKPSSRGRRREGDKETSSKYPPSASRNKFLRGFIRRYSSAGSSTNESTTDLSGSESAPPPVDMRRSMGFPHSFRPYFHHVVLSPYSRFIVLDYDAPAPDQVRTASDKKSSRLQLPVSFCSSTALESLGYGVRTAADVIGYSIFDVLSDKGNSPSISKSFKSTVRATIADGKPVKLDMTLNGHTRSRTRGSSLSRRSNMMYLTNSSSGGDSPHSQGRSLRKSVSLERIVVSRRNSTDGAADFVSYWTPLKDNTGNIQRVVLILVPEVS